MNNLNVVGWDTETYKGYVKLLANSEGKYIESSNTLELLDFLYENGDNQYNVFYNINYDLGSILKQYIVDNAENIRKKLYEDMKIKRIGQEDAELGYIFDIEDYHIRYLSDKMFELRKRKTTRYFWDASNFYKSGYGHLSLNKASEMFLNDKKSDEELSINRAKIGSEEGYYEKNRDKIIKYCIKDAELTKRLFERTIKGYENIGLSFPDKPYSEASIFKNYINSFWDLEKSWAIYYQSIREFSYFYNAYRGGIFLTKKVGHYNDVIDIDINSAYPFVISQLYSIVGSKIVNEPSDYTFYKIEAYPQEYFPLKIKNKLFYGKSKHKMNFYITEYDKEILDLYHYPYEIKEIIGIKTQKKKLPIDINHWYNIKNEIKKKYGKNSVEYLNVKIFINSGYGVFAQSVPSFTKFSNFIYASYITAYTRNYILKLIKGYEDKVISISTDGLVMLKDDKFINNIQDKISDRLGDLSYEEYDSITQYGNGIYLLKNKDRYVLKKRGYEQMKVEDLFKNVYKIEYKSEKPIRMIEGIIQRKFKEINDFSQQIKTFSPYDVWISNNPGFAEKLVDIPINEFHRLQFNVDILDLDKYNWMIKMEVNE